MPHSRRMSLVAIRWLRNTLHGTIVGWIGAPGSGDSRLESYQQTTRHDQSPGFSGKVSPTSAGVLRTEELPIESRDSRPASEQAEVAGTGNTSSTGGRGNNEAEAVATVLEMAGWREKPLTVQPGSTVAEIAANIYGSQRNLGLDLITDIEQVLREKKSCILRCMLDGIKKLQGRVVTWNRFASSVSITEA
jgi:hypothetical protein